VKALLAIYADHDTPPKSDAKRVFRPESERFCDEATAAGWSCTRAPFDNRASLPARRKEVEALIAKRPGPGGTGKWGAIAFFCHGFRTGLQTGHNTLVQARRLADVIATHAESPAIITLYACDAGRDGDADRRDDVQGQGPGGDGGFADKLRDVLSAEHRMHGHVDAHASLGHATKNPFVRRFWMDGQSAAIGGDWLIATGSPAWRAWVRRMASKTDTLRYTFPFDTKVVL
jgi:hypothetical protein